MTLKWQFNGDFLFYSGDFLVISVISGDFGLSSDPRFGTSKMHLSPPVA